MVKYQSLLTSAKAYLLGKGEKGRKEDEHETSDYKIKKKHQGT